MTTEDTKAIGAVLRQQFDKAMLDSPTSTMWAYLQVLAKLGGHSHRQPLPASDQATGVLGSNRQEAQSGA